MALSSPIDVPTVMRIASVNIRRHVAQGQGRSPWTFETQNQTHQGQRLSMDVRLPPIKNRAVAEDIIGWLWSLNGRQYSFLMGVPAYSTPRGTWAGSPKVLGSHAARSASIAMDGFTSGATVKRGDLFQQGTGTASHLHRVTKDATANGSGLLTLEIWPYTRAALADNDTFVTSSPKGIWELSSNVDQYTIDLAKVYGISFSCDEVLP